MDDELEDCELVIHVDRIIDVQGRIWINDEDDNNKMILLDEDYPRLIFDTGFDCDQFAITTDGRIYYIDWNYILNTPTPVRDFHVITGWIDDEMEEGAE